MATVVIVAINTEQEHEIEHLKLQIEEIDVNHTKQLADVENSLLGEIEILKTNLTDLNVKMNPTNELTDQHHANLTAELNTKLNVEDFQTVIEEINEINK